MDERLLTTVAVVLLLTLTVDARRLLTLGDENNFREVCSSSMGTFSVSSEHFISKLTLPDKPTELFVRDAEHWNFR